VTERPSTADQFAEFAAQAFAALDTFLTPDSGEDQPDDLAHLAELIQQDTTRTETR
jgi:hypothetical protein